MGWAGPRSGDAQSDGEEAVRLWQAAADAGYMEGQLNAGMAYWQVSPSHPPPAPFHRCYV